MRSFVALVAVLGVALVGCGGRKAAGPAWPEMAEREQDGGESLEPRTPSVVAEASSSKDEEAAKPEAAAESTTAKPAEETKPADTTPTLGQPVIAPEEVINIDDIVIEIEE